MTKALVTGATGFLGRHTARRLVELGWEVSGLGRNRAIGETLKSEGVIFIGGDLCNSDLVTRACAGQDFVFHCGALSSPWGAARDFYKSNVEGTRNIVEGCKRNEVKRLIHISTPSIYFNYKHRYGIKESEVLPKKSVNAYAATKRMAEETVAQGQDAGLEAVILRPRAIFGPLDTALFPRLLRANKGRGVPLPDGGEALIDLTCVDNVIDAMLLGCTAPSSATGRAYNISNGEPAVFRELLFQLFAMLDIPLRTRVVPYKAAYAAAALLEGLHRCLPALGEPPLTRYSVGTLAMSQTLDISLARDLLGYKPRVTIAEGLQTFADWWREQP